MSLSQTFNMDWVDRDPSGVDGGPLAFLTWSIPALIGTLACDLVMSSRTKAAIVSSLVCSGLLLIALGWVASCVSRCYELAGTRSPRSEGNDCQPARSCRSRRIGPAIRRI